MSVDIGQIDVIYTNFHRAFDLMAHNLLSHKLLNFGAPPNNQLINTISRCANNIFLYKPKQLSIN